jgi:UDP-N-acetylmuramate-alanine ligase
VKEFKKLNQADDLLVVMSNGNFDNLTKLLLKEYKND